MTDLPHVIKQYANRKLYDTAERRFTTLARLRELVRDGIEVIVREHATGRDRTEEVLTQALAAARSVEPLATSVVTTLLRSPTDFTAAGRDDVSTAPPASAAELQALRQQVEHLARTLDDLRRRQESTDDDKRAPTATIADPAGPGKGQEPPGPRHPPVKVGARLSRNASKAV